MHRPPPCADNLVRMSSAPSERPLATTPGESGQAAVETALTMPMVLFVLLGTLQLFMMLQARLMAEYAAYRAVRAGSTHQGDCRAMLQAAIGALLPTITATVDS